MLTGGTQGAQDICREIGDILDDADLLEDAEGDDAHKG